MNSSIDHLAEIERLLSEPIETAAARERDTFGQLLRQTDGSVVLFGAGRLGRLCAQGLRRAGVPLRAFCDRNPAMHGTSLGGTEVLSPEEAARRFGSESLFVVAIWTGTAKESLVERTSWLDALGCRHVATYAPLVWACAREETPFHSFDLPTRVLSRASEWRKLARLLADYESQRVLLAALRQRLHAEFDNQSPAPDQYFPEDILQLTAAEVFVDGGAFDGDTLEAFLTRVGQGDFKYHAFEPDPINVERLRARIAGLPDTIKGRIHVHPVALHSEATELAFSTHGAPTSHAAGGGNVVIAARTLDEELGNVPLVTLLKLDVEGAERAALAGARTLLATRRPSVAMCVYHGPDDLWELPLQLHQALPEHRLHLRQHGSDGWESVCYALAPGRVRVFPTARTKEQTPSRACPVCDSVGAREVLHRQKFFDGPLGDGYDVVVCGNCGAGFADGIPSQAELDRYYAERSKYTYAHSGGAESPYDFKRFETIADQLERYLPSKEARILDIGCATGGLLAVLKRRGYLNVVGSDPAPACAGAAKALHGIEVRTATLAEHAKWSDKFDAVLLVGVLEHLRDVKQAVQIATELLRPDGVLYCAQPDVEAFTECRNAPFQQFSTEHVNFFSRDSLTRLLGEATLTPQTIWRWMVEWREGVIDSVVSGVFSREQGAKGKGWGGGAYDKITGLALSNYLAHSTAHDTAALRKIEELVRAQEPLLVWGTGTLTRRLLATTALARANIVAFVDANPAINGQMLAGRPTIAPAAIKERSGAILICSRTFEAEIRRTIIEELKWRNAVYLLS